MTKVLLKVNNKVMATDGKLMVGEKQEGSLLKNLLDVTKSSSHLFNEYMGQSIQDVINYSDTENVEKMNYMFAHCYNLLDIPPLNTNKVKGFQYTFNNCYYVKKIDISHYNITSTANCQNMFNYCRSILAIIIRSFGDSYVLSSDSIKNCNHLSGEQHGNYNPNGAKDGYIYVPRDMIETLSQSTNWSAYATQLRALEDYTDDGTTQGKFLDEKAGL